MGSGLSTKRVAFVRAEMENNRLEVQGIFSESRARWDKDDHAFQQLHWAADVLQCVVRSSPAPGPAPHASDTGLPAAAAPPIRESHHTATSVTSI